MQSDHIPANLKAELSAILPQIEEMRKRKLDRKNLFVQVMEEIQCIKNEINGSMGFASVNTIVDETDLSLRKLDELQKELQVLHEEKVKSMCCIIICWKQSFYKFLVIYKPFLAE